MTSDLLPDEQRNLYIDGDWREGDGGERFDVLDPADGSTITDVADGSAGDAMDALDAAVAAQHDWARTAPRERGEILRRAFELITERADHFARLISLEMGKTLAEAKGEVTYGAEFFRWFSEEAVRVHGRWMQAPAGGSRLLTIRKPVGPCLFITPWNFPLAMGTRKIGPAVAAGCTMVVKPAELTPLTMLALAALLEEAGLPAGVLNVVPTSNSKELSKTLMADDRLRKVSFTGSTPVGKVLVRQSADELQRVSMELGGNAPFVVFEDADVDAAVDGAMIAKMRNMGEACTAANRFLVHEDVAEVFAGKLGERMGALTVGRGQDEGVDVGPLINPDAVESIGELVTDAIHDGATVVTGGSAPDGPGWFYEPDGPARRAGGGADQPGRDLRPGRADHDVRHRGRGRRARQRDAVRAHVLRLHARPRPHHPAGRVARLRHGRRQHRAGLQPGRAVRRGQGERLRPRGRLRGHRRVPRHDVRRAAGGLTLQLYTDVAEQYVDFARYAGDSPCFEAWALSVAEDEAVLAWIATLPPVKQQPNLVFAAARWHGVAAPGPYAGLRDALLGDDGAIRATILERATQTNEVGRLATLTPFLAGLGPRLALLEVGASAGLCLYPDRYSYDWSTSSGVVSAGSGPRLSCEVTGAFPRSVTPPSVTWRGGIDLHPLDPTDADAMAWLTNLVWPEQDERRERLQTAIGIARDEPPRLVTGDLLDELPELVGEAAELGPVVVFHSAVIAYLEPADRERFVALMTSLVGARRCHWVSNEAPQVLPSVTATGPDVPDGLATFVLGVDGRARAWTHGHGASMTVL